MTYNTPSQLSINPEAERVARGRIIEVVNKINQRLQHFARHHVLLNYQITNLIEGLPSVNVPPSPYFPLPPSHRDCTDYPQLYEHHSYINTGLQGMHCPTTAKEREYLDAGRDEIDEAIAGVVEALDRYRELYGAIGDQSLSLFEKMSWPPIPKIVDDVAFRCFHEGSRRESNVMS